jgi:hypothetical protein
MSNIRCQARRIAILLLPIALGACTQYGLMNTSASIGPSAIAWDGAGEDPNLPQPAHKRVRNAPQVAAQSAVESEQASPEDADRALERKLVICSGCIKPTQTTDRPEETRVANR